MKVKIKAVKYDRELLEIDFVLYKGNIKLTGTLSKPYTQLPDEDNIKRILDEVFIN